MEVGRFHKIYRFPNGYGASVLSANKKEAAGSYKTLIVKFTGERDYEITVPPGWDSETVFCADSRSVSELLKMIKELP
jgi:hypothetical protein